MKPIVFLLIIVSAFGCGAPKFVPEQKTLAQQCAETYPCVDTIQTVLVEVEVPVPGLDTVIRDTTPCLDSVAYVEKILKVPGRTTYIQKKVFTPSALDSALRVAYAHLQTQYEKSIRDLEDCNRRIKTKAPQKTDWKIWIVVLGLVVALVGVVWRKK